MGQCRIANAGKKRRRVTAKRFDVRAASHGAAGVGLIVIFGEAGIVILFGLDGVGIAICLLILSFSYAIAMLFFGFMTRVDDE
jgi:hypothetical protein